ncbi:MAG: hypothetical protein U0Q12_05370 [Vicinamibacterales bacterium]
MSMSSRRWFVLAVLLFPSLALAQDASNRKAIRVVQDHASFVRELRTHRVPERHGIEKAKTDRDDARTRSFPHFTSSFTYKGQTFPYTMVGYPPASGRTTNIRSVIVPLRMNFVGFDQDMVFEPKRAVQNIVNSPLYQEATFANGVGQFGDQLQRATFWNKMDARHRWHINMMRPRVLPTIDVRVEPDIGEILQLGPGQFLGNMRIGAMDSTLHTILQFIDVDPDEVPIFVTDNVFADALGYHDAFDVANRDGSETLQTLIYTSWLDGDIVGDLLADVSTFNHELGEWLNDPYVNNIVPLWAFPPSNTVCGDNPFLEVGDPQGNGPEFFLFPTVPVPLNGFVYHLQDLVMLPWFAGEVPSSAQNGWYDFPDTTQIKTPFVPCKP